LFFSNCKIPRSISHATYFSDSITGADSVLQPNIILIKPGDRLNITITAINKEAAQAFDVTTTGTGAASGYLVDSLGNIQLLQLGVMHVQGMSVAQLTDSLRNVLSAYVKGPVVTVSIINFQVNIMGEVGHPGVINVPDGRMTILQAITASGDITQYGLRDNILVIREANGKRQFGRVDISSNRVFESPYYYLQQNDVVYVEADKTKYHDVLINRGLRNVTIATSFISIILLVLNLTKK
jgi:polysaccharide export outer membrane protein